jgi:hypothetical protein
MSSLTLSTNAFKGLKALCHDLLSEIYYEIENSLFELHRIIRKNSSRQQGSVLRKHKLKLKRNGE